MAVDVYFVRRDPEFFKHGPFDLQSDTYNAKYNDFPPGFLDAAFTANAANNMKYPAGRIIKSDELGFYFIEALDPTDLAGGYYGNPDYTVTAEAFGTFHRLDWMAINTIPILPMPTGWPRYGLTDVYICNYTGPRYVHGPTAGGPTNAVLYNSTTYPIYNAPTRHNSFSDLQIVIGGDTSEYVVLCWGGFGIGLSGTASSGAYTLVGLDPNPSFGGLWSVWSSYLEDYNFVLLTRISAGIVLPGED